VGHDGLVAGVQIVALLAAVVFALLVLVRHRRLGPTRATGLILGAVVLCSPVTWPWYFVWPVLLLGATPRARMWPVLVLAGGFALFVTEADGSAVVFDTAGTVIAGLVVAAIFVTTVRWSYRHLVRPRPAVRAGG
jgi:alpha-1,6-mannosyltransferase